MPSNNLLAQADIFGTVTPPAGAARYGEDAGGLITFIGAGIQLFTIVAGLYVFANFLLAGYEYITAGDNKAHQKVREKLTNSVLGLVIIVGSYTLVALLSLIFFGNPGYILNPTIIGPGGN